MALVDYNGWKSPERLLAGKIQNKLDVEANYTGMICHVRCVSSILIRYQPT